MVSTWSYKNSWSSLCFKTYALFPQNYKVSASSPTFKSLLLSLSSYHFLPLLSLSHAPSSSQGCSAPLVVKIADTEKEKNAKRLHGTLPTVGEVNCVGMNALGGLNPIHAAAYYQVRSYSCSSVLPGSSFT